MIKKFDKQQLKEFSSFVKSPFFNSNKALIKLYEYIRRQYPDYNPKSLEKKYVYKKLFAKTEFNDGFFRVMMSNLQALVEEYLTQKGIEKNPLFKKKFLLDELNNSGLKKLAEKTLDKEIKKLSGLIKKSADEYLGLHNLAHLRNYFYSSNFEVSKGNEPDEKMYDEPKYLVQFFLMKILSNHFYHLNQSEIINYKPKLIFLEEASRFLEKNPEYLEDPLLNITYLRVMLLKNNNIEDLYRLKKAFYESYNKLSLLDSFNTGAILVNFCNRKIMMTREDTFMKERYEILKFIVEKGLNRSQEHDWFHVANFYLYVRSALYFGEADECEKFINEYKDRLNPEIKDDWVNLSMADLHYGKKEYEKALGSLSKIKKMKNAAIKFNSKMLQLKLYYDMDLPEQAESAADSFIHLLQNDKLLPALNKESYRNFCSLFVKVLALKYNTNNSDGRSLKEQVNSTQYVSSKSWLLERI